LRRARQEFSIKESELTDVLLPILGLQPKKRILEEYERVSRLDSSLLDHIAENRMPFRGAHILDRLEIEDQKVFAEVIPSKATLTPSELLQVGEWICDLLKSSPSEMNEWMKSKVVQDIVNDPDLNRRQKGDQLFHALRNHRFPRLVACEKKFHSLSHQVCKDMKDVKLEIPASFEEDGYFLRMRVRDPKGLEDILNRIREKKSSLNSLFDIML